MSCDSGPSTGRARRGARQCRADSGTAPRRARKPTPDAPLTHNVHSIIGKQSARTHPEMRADRIEAGGTSRLLEPDVITGAVIPVDHA